MGVGVGGVAGVGALLEGVDVGVGFGVGIGVSVGLGVGCSGHETVTFDVATDEAVPPSIVAMTAAYAVWPDGTKKWPAPRCWNVYTLPGASNGASSPREFSSLDDVLAFEEYVQNMMNDEAETEWFYK